MSYFKRNSLLLFIFGFIFTSQLFAGDIFVPIKYISSEHLYISLEKNTLIRIGDTLEVIRNDEEIGQISVVYISTYSASCKALKKGSDFTLNDVVKIHINKKQDIKKTILSTEKKSNNISRIRSLRSAPIQIKDHKSSSTWQGKASLSVSGMRDLGSSEFTNNQPSIYLRIVGKNLFNRGLELRMRSRYKYIARSTRSLSEYNSSEWITKLYEFSINYDKQNSKFQYSLGRILTKNISGEGYIDGAQASVHILNNLDVGGFAGTRSDLRTSAFQTDFQKYGVYISRQQKTFSQHRFDMSIAAVGEYYRGNINREFLTIQNRYTYGSKFWLYQQSDVDINRDWKKKLLGESYSLTGMFIFLNYKINEKYSININSDHRSLYSVYEYHSEMDSLFDKNTRQGIRTGFRYRPGKTMTVSANMGLRSGNEITGNTYSFSLRVHKNQFINSKLSAGVNSRTFQNNLSQAINTSFYISKLIKRKHNLRISIGNYYYSVEKHHYNQLQLSTYLSYNINNHLDLNSHLYYYSGSQQKYYRYNINLGYRL